jgi:phage terminase large subunit
MKPQQISLGYEARPQFAGFHARKQRWACLVAHRRAGKTVACVMDLVDAALRCPKPDARFAYVAPTYTQAKDVAWLYLKRFTAPLPGVEQRESDLTVNLPNGARIRLYGADNYDRLRGLFFDGIVLDEYGDMDPRAWPEVIRPALSDRQGWAVFIGTPKGSNHFREVWDAAQGDTAWYRAMLRASETGILPPGELADIRKTLSEDQYAQELECSFDAAIIGAYYAPDLNRIEKQVCRVVWEPKVPVHTAWDLGRGASNETSIWMFQQVGSEVRVVDYESGNSLNLAGYVNLLRERPYVWGTDLLPHDAEPKRLQTGESVQDTLRGLGRPNSVIVPMHNVADGINAVQMMLPRCWFDAEKCKDGLNALRHYRREFDEKRKTFKDRPDHNWASHGADAFRYLAMGLRLIVKPDEWGKPISYPKSGIV